MDTVARKRSSIEIAAIRLVDSLLPEPRLPTLTPIEREPEAVRVIEWYARRMPGVL